MDTSLITRGGERLGIYFLEKGASQRPSKVVYDRAHSSISEATQEDFDWNKIFEGVDWFHFTGITPALGKNVADICLTAVKEAKKRNITISCDLNYRKKLWSKQEANETMSKLAEYIDVVIANEEDAADVFDIHASKSDVTKGELNRDGYIEVAKKLTDTLRESISANDNKWSGMLYVNGEAYFSRKYDVHIVDRVGGGDSFGGGLIYSLLNEFEPQKAIEFAVGASCLKHTIEGDYNLVSVDEVLSLIGGDASGRVQR